MREQNKPTLLQKLLIIQRSIDSFTKDKKGHNYDYVTGNQVLEIIRPLMNEHSILLKQEVVSIKNRRIDYLMGKDSKAKSEMFTTTDQLFTWIDCDSGEREECRWAANGQNDWDKGLGSALTYAERYFLLKFFHVPTDGDDPDYRQGEGSAPSQPQNAYPEDNRAWLTDKQFEAVIARVKAGEKEVIKKTLDTYRVKKDFRTQLDALK